MANNRDVSQGLPWDDNAAAPPSPSVGTSLESLSSIPEGRVTPSIPFPGSKRAGGVTRHHSSVVGRASPAGPPGSAVGDPRPWQCSLRRQNSAPQLEPPFLPPGGGGSGGMGRMQAASPTPVSHHARFRLASSESVNQPRSRHGSSESVHSTTTRSRHGSSESVNSVNSDGGFNRTSRCPACASHPHGDEEPVHHRASPALGLKRKVGQRRSYHGNEILHTHAPSSGVPDGRRTPQGHHHHHHASPSLDKSNSFGDADHAVGRRGGLQGNGVGGGGGGVRQSNSFGEVDSAHSHSGHSGRKRSERFGDGGEVDSGRKRSERSGYDDDEVDSGRKRSERSEGGDGERSQASEVGDGVIDSAHSGHSGRKRSERSAGAGDQPHVSDRARRITERLSSSVGSHHHTGDTDASAITPTPTPALRRKSEKISFGAYESVSPAPKAVAPPVPARRIRSDQRQVSSSQPHHAHNSNSDFSPAAAAADDGTPTTSGRKRSERVASPAQSHTHSQSHSQSQTHHQSHPLSQTPDPENNTQGQAGGGARRSERVSSGSRSQSHDSQSQNPQSQSHSQSQPHSQSHHTHSQADTPGQNSGRRRRSERSGLQRSGSSIGHDSRSSHNNNNSETQQHATVSRTGSGRGAQKVKVIRKVSRKGSSAGDAKARLRGQQRRGDGSQSPSPLSLQGKSGFFDLDKALAESRASALQEDQAKSEDQVETERQWLEAERTWLVHKGGFTSAMLQQQPPGGSTAAAEGSVNIKLDSGEVLTVDEEDVEKANPSAQDRVEDLTSLRYLNESSALHVLRQRYAGNLPHTYAGPALLVLNPMKTLPLYSEKIIQMFRGCKQEDLPPHIFSAAQMALRELLNTRRDQSLVLMGRSGAGKTTSAFHCLHYLLVAAGTVNNIFTPDKLSAISVLLKAFGNCKTLLNTNASRYTQVTTLDFDPSGVIASASVQVLMFEKSRVVRRPEGEPTFNIMYYLLAGVDAALRKELHLQNLTEPNQFMTPLQRTEEEEEQDRQKATNEFGQVQQAFQIIGASEEEVKVILSVLAAVYLLGVAGACKGQHNKFQFQRPAAAQKAASLLGTTPEELARSIYSPGGTSTLQRNTSIRVAGGMDKAGYQTADAHTSVTDALEAFLVGLYTDAFNAVVSLINRSLASNVRTLTSLVVVDSPGFQNPATGGRQTGANFEDLCCNYLHERLQLLYHENMLTQPQDRYAQENIDCEFDQVTSSPAALVSLMDQAPQQGIMRSSNTDLRNADKKGLLWILDEESMFPGASEDSFMERFFTQHGDQQVRRDSLLRKGSVGQTFVLNHNQGTAPVQYNAAGWLRVCRDNPISKNSTVILQDSKNAPMNQLFSSIKGAVGGIVSGSIAGMEGSASLRRVGSMRRTFMSGTAALKKKSVCIQIKFQVDSVMEIVRKTQPHFVFCFLPQQTAGLCDLKDKVNGEEVQVNVPLLRSQLRGFEILDALRLHRQGFPEFMQFREFMQKFQALVPPHNRPGAGAEEKQAANQVLDHLDVDKLNYRVGLSKVFFRPGVLSQLEATRDEKLTGIVTHFQALCRGYLGRKKIETLRVQHLAVRCIQRNVKKYMLIREWPWWKLYTKVKPILNVHRTEEDLIDALADLEAMKTKVEKLERERNEYKSACEKLETRLAEVRADLMEENTTSTQAGDMLEAEAAERMRLEKELKDLQAKYSPLKRQNERLEMEVMQTRVWQAQTMEDDLEDDVDGGSSLYKEKCERLSRELQMTKKQMQQNHEEDLEQELASRKMVEKRLHEAVEEAEEQRRQVQVAKKKTQRLTAEMQDTKLHLEEQMARNNELERKQRRFDSELSAAQEDAREEKAMREKVQRERDATLSEKYSLEQSVQSLRLDHTSATEKADRLDKELNDILVSGKDNSEAVSLKRAKHELELKLREQEEELDDQAGQIQQLEQAKLRLEMNVEKTKKQHSQELEEKEEELEEMRTKTQKKLRSMESQLEEEYEEKRRVMEEKANVERQLTEYGARQPARDKDCEKRLKRNLRKTKALLADAGTMLAKQKNTEGAKQQIAGLRNQLDDAQFSANAALKAKKRMELEIQDMQQQIEDMSRTKQEVDNKNMGLLREKTDLQTQLEENEEDMSEIMKKYKAAVQQQSVHQITLTDQLQQIEELIRERDTLREQVADLSQRLQGFEVGMVDKHALTRLETKLRDTESRLELEQSQRQRSETQLSRVKETVEKVSTEKDDVTTSRVTAEEVSKRAQKTLRDLREELADAQKKEMEASQKFKERAGEFETLEAELAQCRADLKLAFKRITDLQAALEDELDSDEDSLNLDEDDDSELDSEEDGDLNSYLGNHHRAGNRHSGYSGATHNGLSEA